MKIKTLLDDIELQDAANVKSPRIIFKYKAMEDIKKMMFSTHAQTLEFGFMCLVDEGPYNTYFVTRADLMYNTKTSGVYWENDKGPNNTKSTEWYFETYGRLHPDSKKARMYSHSHVNMGTSPSGTDNDQFKVEYENRKDFYIQLIVNHQDTWTANVVDCKTRIRFDEVPIYFQIDETYLFDMASRELKTLETIDENGDITGYEVHDFIVGDGAYNVKDGKLVINDNVKVSIDGKDYSFKVDKLHYDSSDVSRHGSTIKIDMSPEDIKAIDEYFAKYIDPNYSHVKKSYSSNYSIYNSRYAEDEEDEDDAIKKYIYEEEDAELRARLTHYVNYGKSRRGGK